MKFRDVLVICTLLVVTMLSFAAGYKFQERNIWSRIVYPVIPVEQSDRDTVLEYLARARTSHEKAIEQGVGDPTFHEGCIARYSAISDYILRR